MSSVNFVGGGLDVLGIVDNLIFVEREPIRRLEKQSQSFQSRVSAFQDFNSKLLALKTSIDSALFKDETVPLNLPTSFANRLQKSVFTLRTASSSDETILTAAADKGATAGNYSVTVSALASFDAHASNNFASDTTTTSKEGTLIIQKGTETAVTITVDSTNNTLQGIKSAINNENAGFTASIINDGSATPYKLVLTSDDSGTANALTITNNLTSGSGQDLTLAETVTAADASLTVNGVSITKSSNTVSDAIEGVTLNLETVSATTVTVSVDRDLDSVVEGIKDVVEKFNAVNSFIGAQFSFDASKETSGVLSGDSTLRSAQFELQSLITKSISNSLGSLEIIGQVGISFNSDGSLSLDETELRDALESNFQDVPALLLGEDATGSIFFELQAALKNLTDPLDGAVFRAQNGVQKNIDQLAEQIADMDERLEVRRELLTLEFARADAALKQLSTLQASLSNQLAAIPS